MFGKEQSIATIIDPSVKLEGHFSTEADLIINGRIEGVIESVKNIEVRESASIEAEVKADNIMVAGKIKGNVEARESLNIVSTGRISGNIKCKLLNIEIGAQLNGKCVMPQEIQPAKGKKIFSKKAELHAQEDVESAAAS
ncbi:MAG: polymer-forming cytoskeletal protein [Candidatus Kuenenbacteria bacterium]